MCRYGMACYRVHCRYTHHNEKDRASSLAAAWFDAARVAERDTIASKMMLKENLVTKWNSAAWQPS